MLPCVCSVIDHRGHQNVVRTSVTHSTITSCATFLFLSHFDVNCDLLLDRQHGIYLLNRWRRWRREGPYCDEIAFRMLGNKKRGVRGILSLLDDLVPSDLHGKCLLKAILTFFRFRFLTRFFRTGPCFLTFDCWRAFVVRSTCKKLEGQWLHVYEYIMLRALVNKSFLWYVLKHCQVQWGSCDE